MGNETIDFSHLNLLRTTSDKKTVLHLFTQTFNNRLGGANAHLTKEWLELFDAGEEDIEMVFFALTHKSRCSRNKQKVFFCKPSVKEKNTISCNFFREVCSKNKRVLFSNSLGRNVKCCFYS
jgi:hypothetical protein